MQSKVVYQDSGVDKAITGNVVKEDQYFLEILSRGRTYRIAKQRVVCVKQSKECEEDGSS